MSKPSSSYAFRLLLGCLAVAGAASPVLSSSTDVKVSVSGGVKTVPAEAVTWGSPPSKPCYPWEATAAASRNPDAGGAFFLVPIPPEQKGHVLRLESPGATRMSARWLGGTPTSVPEEMYFATGPRGAWLPSANPYNGQAELLVPHTQAGKLLVFVRDIDPPVDLNATLLPSILLSLSPGVASAGEVTVRVKGGGFREDSKFHFKNDQGAVSADARVLSPWEAVLSATLKAGHYDLEHLGRDGCTSVLEDALEVRVHKGPPKLRVDAHTSGSYTENSVGELTVKWENVGGQAFEAPVLLRVEASAREPVYTTLDDRYFGEGPIERRFGSPLLHLWDQGVYILAVGDLGEPLQPNETHSARVYFWTATGVDEEIEFRVHEYVPGDARIPASAPPVPEGFTASAWPSLYAWLRGAMDSKWQNLPELLGQHAVQAVGSRVPPYSVRRLFDGIADAQGAAPRGVLAGYAYDEDTGAPAFCAYCIARRLDSSGRTFKVQTDGEGRFFFGRLPEGRYDVRIYGATGSQEVEVEPSIPKYSWVGVRGYKAFLQPETGSPLVARLSDHLRDPGRFTRAVGRAVAVVTGPVDPNSKGGPEISPPIPPQGPWNFIIDFKNKVGEASEVVVTDNFQGTDPSSGSPETDFDSANINLGDVEVDDGGYGFTVSGLMPSGYTVPLSDYSTGTASTSTFFGYHIVVDWTVYDHKVEWVIAARQGCPPNNWYQTVPFLGVDEGGEVYFTTHDVVCQPPTHNEGAIKFNTMGVVDFYYDETLCQH